MRFKQESSGYMGGVIGASRTRKNMEKLRDELTAGFSERGLLIGVQETK